MAKLISLEEAYGSTTAVAPKRRLISLSEAYGSSAYTPPASEDKEVDDFMSTLALMERVNADPADQPDYEGPNIQLEQMRQLERNIEMPPGFDPVRFARFAGSRFINRAARDIRSFGAKLAWGWQTVMGQPTVDGPTPTEVLERCLELANEPVVQEEAPRDFADKLAIVAGELGVDVAELIPAGAIIPGAAAIKALRKGGKLAKLGAAALTTARGAATFGLQSAVTAQEVEEIGHGIGMGAAFGAIEALPGARLPAKVAKTFLEGIALERMTALNATEENPLLEERMIAFLTPFGLKGASKAAKTLARIVQGGQSLDTSRKTFDAMGLERTTAAQREAISQGVEAIKQLDPRSPLRQPQPEPTFGPESFTDPAKARAAMEAEVKAAETTPIEGKEAPSGQQVPGNQVQADEGGIRRKGGGLLREDAVRPEPGSPQVEGDAGVGGGEGQPARKGLTRPRDGGSSGLTQETPVEARETAATGRETAAQGPEATVVAPEAGKGKKKGKKGLTRETPVEASETAAQQLAISSGTPYLDIRDLPSYPILDGLLTYEQFLEYRVAPLVYGPETKAVELGITAATDRTRLQEIVTKLDGHQVTFKTISDAGFEEIINSLYLSSFKKELDGDFAAFGPRLAATVPKQAFQLIAQLAHLLRSSDIHIEPQEGAARIRFRIDGTLHPITTVNAESYKVFLADLQTRANIKWGSDDPQSGRISFELVDSKGQKQSVNMRIETIPSFHGEEIVVRIFGMEATFLRLDNRGFSEQQLATLQTAIHRPNGMILAVGPTGSGKTLVGLTRPVQGSEAKSFC